MKRRLLSALGFIAALAFCVAAPVAAQTDPVAAQILTLDQDRFYMDSQYGKALEARALAANQALAAENRRIETDLAVEEADLTQKRATMTAAEFQGLADAFDAKVEKLRSDQSGKVDALKAQREAGRKTFFQAAVPVLADMMRQMGAYAILNRDAVVLSFDAIDVTDRAIKAVDAKVGDGSALPEGPRVPAANGVVQGTEPPARPPAEVVPQIAPDTAPNTGTATTPDPAPETAPDGVIRPEAGAPAPALPAPPSP
ncbi:MAG: OmpH family outer membrane protein [Cypionkella sp.]